MFPSLWIVAGPNGAGKTTAVQRVRLTELMPGLPVLNPDDRTLQKLRAAGFSGFADAPAEIQTRRFIESADEVAAELEGAIDRVEPVGVETVLSSEKYRGPVESVLERAGFFGLVYIALASPEISRRRIAARVRLGGHGVPDDKIPVRWQRSLDTLPWFAARASAFWVVDNSVPDPAIPLRLLASGTSGKLDYRSEDVFPEMARALAPLPR